MAVQDRLVSALKKALIIDNARQGEVRFYSSSLQAVEEAEAVWGIRFPDDFRDFMLEYGGCTLETAHRVIMPGRGTWELGHGIFGVDGAEPTQMVKRDVVGLWNEDCDSLRDELELDPGWGAKVVPVAGREPPFLYCFDFRFDPVAPPIVFYDIETGIHWDDGYTPQFTGLEYVADSFTHFAEQLRYNPEDFEAINQESKDYPKSDRQLEWEAATQAEARRRVLPKTEGGLSDAPLSSGGCLQSSSG